MQRGSAKQRAAFCPRHAAVNPHVAPLTNDYGNCPIMRGALEICMKMKVQLVIEDESGGTTTTDLVDIERGAEGLIGLSLAVLISGAFIATLAARTATVAQRLVDPAAVYRSGS